MNFQEEKTTFWPEVEVSLVRVLHACLHVNSARDALMSAVYVAGSPMCVVNVPVFDAAGTNLPGILHY
jgi:hypothetical protein